MTSRPPGLPIGYLVGGKLGSREGDQKREWTIEATRFVF